MKYFTLALIFFALSHTVTSKPASNNENTDDEYDVQNDENYDENYDVAEEEAPAESDNDILPKIVSKPENFIVKLGSSVMLPCNISDLGVYDYIWRLEPNKILFQGSQSLTDDKNLVQHDNGSLQIVKFSANDAGSYICQLMIANDNRPSITHTVKMLTIPKITTLTTNTIDNKTIFDTGDSVQIICKATGEPKPKISWWKGMHTSNKLSINGEVLTLNSLTHKESDTYRCFADNGETDHQSITIHVNHKPIVHIERYAVNSDREQNAELKCTVSAYPAALVNWYRDDELIQHNPPHFDVKKEGHHTILTINKVQDEDFGSYTCKAVNVLGTTEKNVNLVRTPTIQEFIKPTSSNNVVLTWKVESNSPISEHELQYRRKGENEWKVLKPQVTKGDEKNLYTIRYTLDHLEPGSYECRVRSANSHGWSDYSNVMPFEGVVVEKKHNSHKNHNKKQHKSKEMQIQEGTPAQHQENNNINTNNDKETLVGASQTSSASIATTTTFLLLSSIAIYFMRA